MQRVPPTLVLAFSLAFSSAAAQDVTCVRITPEQTAAIESGLTVSGGGSIEAGWAVRSGAHHNLYFVSADIGGPGLEGPNDVGTWAMNDVEAGTVGLVLAVNSMAREFSVFPDGRSTDAETSMDDPGARESQGCVD